MARVFIRRERVETCPVELSITPGIRRPPHLHVQPGRLSDLFYLPPQFGRLAFVERRDGAIRHPGRLERTTQVAERQTTAAIALLAFFLAVESADSCASQDALGATSTANVWKRHRLTRARVSWRDDQRRRRPGRQSARQDRPWSTAATAAGRTADLMRSRRAAFWRARHARWRSRSFAVA